MSQVQSNDDVHTIGVIGVPMEEDSLADALPEPMFRFVMHHARELGVGFASMMSSMSKMDSDVSDPHLTDEDRKSIKEAAEVWAKTDPAIMATAFIAGYTKGMYDGAMWHNISAALASSMWDNDEDEEDIPDDM